VVNERTDNYGCAENFSPASIYRQPVLVVYGRIKYYGRADKNFSPADDLKLHAMADDDESYINGMVVLVKK
jgi:hypothetical protein